MRPGGVFIARKKSTLYKKFDFANFFQSMRRKTLYSERKMSYVENSRLLIRIGKTALSRLSRIK
jgi:hypothetical protein